MVQPRTEAELLAAVAAAFTEEAAELLRVAERAVGALGEAEPAARAAQLLEALRALHTLKGGASSVGAAELAGGVHALEAELRAIEGAEPLGPAARDALFGKLEGLQASLARWISGGAAVAIADAPAPQHPGAAELLRVRPERIDALHALVGELVMIRLQHRALSQQLTGLRDQLEEVSSGWRALSSQLERQREDAVDLRSAGANLGADLQSLGRGLVAVARDMPNLEAQAAAVSASLEDGIRELRLMPLAPFFEEYGRVLRETARSTGKEVRLVVRAEGAEIDRSVLARLRDPLLHLVRNAVVHGLETPEARLRAGKPREGVLALEARSAGTRAVLRVVDDGAGLDLPRIRGCALELGVPDPGAAPTSQALLDVLTQPGFTTRAVADDLAGRGIGLDVVASRVRELEGRLQLESRPGAGCTFTIDVPVSASTTVGLVVSAGAQSFGILLNAVERVLRVERDQVVRVEPGAALRVDGELVGVLALSELLGEPSGAEGKLPAVVLRHGRHRLVLVVDELPGEQTLVIKPLPRAFHQASLVRGGAIQPDGSILPVLEIAALFELAARARPGAGLASRAQRKLQVLVVDDSITMRTLLRNILRSAGHEVTVAHDGQAAREVYENGSAFDLVISDLQMPRLDGSGLCRAIRHSARPQTPVVLVTSVGDPEERRKAMEAGADAYLIKSDFEQAHFLELVRTLTWRGAAAA